MTEIAQASKRRRWNRTTVLSINRRVLSRRYILRGVTLEVHLPGSDSLRYILRGVTTNGIVSVESHSMVCSLRCIIRGVTLEGTSSGESVTFYGTVSGESLSTVLPPGIYCLQCILARRSHSLRLQGVAIDCVAILNFNIYILYDLYNINMLNCNIPSSFIFE